MLSLLQQEGSLCAQHCLNSLLQGPYFTPVDLSSLALKMDEAERQRMAECGEESEEYQRFIRQPSGNMDDSGYFSVQVISSALEVWGLEIVPYSSTDERVRHVLSEPCHMQAFICNYKDHWFTIRKLGQQWFNLNSLLKRPQLISDTYLSLFLAQLKADGYSIFVVFGSLPECDADNLLRVQPVQALSPHHEQQQQQMVRAPETSDADLQAAIEMSLDNSEDDLQRALEMSLECTSTNSSTPEDTAIAGTSGIGGGGNDDDDEALLRKAIHMSLEC